MNINVKLKYAKKGAIINCKDLWFHTSLKSSRLKEQNRPAVMYNGDRARHMMMMSDLASYADMLYQLQSYAAYAICVLCNTQYNDI